MSEIIEGLEWWHIYWVSGDLPRHSEYRNSVKNPPCAGWQHALVLRGAKRSTILCPYTLEANTVHNDAGELRGAKEPRDAVSATQIIALLHGKWAEYQSLGLTRDYDTTALVLRKLGATVPAQMLKGGETDTRQKGGKDTAYALKKPVKRSSKRGKFLEWFLDAGGSCSVREAMAEFGMTRSNALSYLYMIQKDHGIGYTLVGDMAHVALPDGCTNPFDSGDAPTKASAPAEDDGWLDTPAAPTEDTDDSWLYDAAPAKDVPDGSDDSWLDG